METGDFLIGDVTDVIDKETITVKVERNVEGNRYESKYKDQEKIQINRIYLKDIVWLIGSSTQAQIESMLKGKRIGCRIRSRIPGGGINADVLLCSDGLVMRKGA